MESRKLNDPVKEIKKVKTKKQKSVVATSKTKCQKRSLQQRQIKDYFKKPLNNIEKSPVKMDTSCIDASFYNLSPESMLDRFVPSNEELVRRAEKEKKWKALNASIQESAQRFYKQLELESTVDDVLSIESTKTPVTIKDCKSLTIKELAYKFKNDVNYLDDLFHGRVYNERYQAFLVDNPKNNNTCKDLRRSSTWNVFTFDQITYVLKLMRRRYANGTSTRHDDFFYKVLLPEYFLKIFSELYNMDTKEALTYINSLPISILKL